MQHTSLIPIGNLNNFGPSIIHNSTTNGPVISPVKSPKNPEPCLMKKKSINGKNVKQEADLDEEDDAVKYKRISHSTRLKLIHANKTLGYNKG